MITEMALLCPKILYKTCILSPVIMPGLFLICFNISNNLLYPYSLYEGLVVGL